MNGLIGKDDGKSKTGGNNNQEGTEKEETKFVKSTKVRLGADTNDEYWDENVQTLKADKNPVQKIVDKKKMSNVLKEYNDLFVSSKILERIIPRKINDPTELR